MYIEIYTEHVSNNGTGRETKGGGEEGKIENNNEIHHICAGTRHKET
jgi:hypothetical protein